MNDWERNYNKEGLVKGREWWTLSRPLFSLHVYNEADGDGWRWKIFSAVPCAGNESYITREIAESACKAALVVMKRESGF